MRWWIAIVRNSANPFSLYGGLRGGEIMVTKALKMRGRLMFSARFISKAVLRLNSTPFCQSNNAPFRRSRTIFLVNRPIGGGGGSSGNFSLPICFLIISF